MNTEVKEKIANVSSLGGNPEKYKDGFKCKHPWPEDCFCQSGCSGVVFSKDGGYETAFFEAFPKKPSTFIRGEGKSIEESEEDAWKQFVKFRDCPDHEFERRSYTNGAGFCKHCGMFSSGVFEPTTRCEICDKPTTWSSDTRSKFYCKKHARLMPKKYRYDSVFAGKGNRQPRKLKKRIKKAHSIVFEFKHGYAPKMIRTMHMGRYITKCGYRMNPFFGYRKLFKAAAAAIQIKKLKR